MTYFITGATGTLGREVVKSLVQKGHRVVAGGRKSIQETEEQDTLLKRVHFDYEDKSTFIHAENVDGVFLMEAPALDPQHTDLAAQFFEFLEKTKPSRLVYLSSNGMETLKEVPFHLRMEQRLKESNLNWHIVRPSFYAQSFGVYERENIEQRNIIFLPAGKGKTAFLSTVDIGEAIAVLLTEEQFKNSVVSILTGEKTFDHFEVASLLSDILGRTITNVDPDVNEYRKVLKSNNVPEMVADYIIPLYGLIKDDKVNQVTPTLKKLIVKNPESLKEVLKRDFLNESL